MQTASPTKSRHAASGADEETPAIFRGLSAAEMATIAPELHEMQVPARTNLMALEQPGNTVYVIVEGTVRVQAEQEDGSLVILGFLGPGDTVGEMSIIERSGRSATVVALEPCRVLWLHRSAFTSALQACPRLAVNLLEVLSRRLRMADERIQALATLDVGGRVARQLIAMAELYGEPTPDGDVRIPLRMTQADLADAVGASRERVNRVVVDLRRRGLVSVAAGHRLVIHDADAIARRLL